MTELGEFGKYLAMGAVGIFFMIAIAPVFKALARRIDGTAGESPDMEALVNRIAALEQRGLTSGEVDNQFLRLNELEERMDFAERVLTQGEARQPVSGSDNS